MKKLLLLVLLGSQWLASAQKSSIPVGEQFTYTASYNMAGLMTQLAQVTLSTEMVSTSTKNLLHLSCEAATYSKWDSFFKIRDSYESYVDPVSLKPSLYKRDIFEGGYTKKEKYLFQKDGKSIASTVLKKKKARNESHICHQIRHPRHCFAHLQIENNRFCAPNQATNYALYCRI